MWHKIKELNSNGLTKTQISRLTGLHRQTVAKYIGMSEQEFVSSQAYSRNYAHKLDRHESFVAEELRNPAGLSAAQIEDHLRQKPDYDPATCSKTVYNFVQYVRRKHNIPLPQHERLRQFEKLQETAPGEYAQVDFGERHMTVAGGKPQKVYFFAMSMSHSRQKFLFFRDKPFNTQWTVYAHQKAFEFYGGVPHKIIYDQDKVLLASENHGDYIYTRGFKALVAEAGFAPVFCRKSDPQSKGKIENVVKYVKNNFLKGREFTDTDSLNAEAMAWLERTGNGTVHHGTHRIPADMFQAEKDCLLPYAGAAAEPADEMRQYKVRKDNTISYRCCFYALPIGTYQGPDTAVFLEESDGKVTLYSVQTGKVIISHPLSREKGKLVSSGSTRRLPDASIGELRRRLMDYIGESAEAEAYLDKMHSLKSRYFRDTLSTLVKKTEKYSASAMRSAIMMCKEKDIYAFTMLLDAMETIRLRNGEKIKDTPAVAAERHCDAASSETIPEKTDMNAYNLIFEA